MRTRLLPALGVLAGGLAYAVLPHGAFGSHDVMARAAVTAAAAAVACLIILTLSKRSGRSIG